MKLLPIVISILISLCSLQVFAEELPKEAQRMLDDLGAPDVQEKNNGKTFGCLYGGKKTIKISPLQDATLFSGDYNNCREAGSTRDGYYEVIVRDYEIIGQSSKRSINGELQDAARTGDVKKARKLIRKQADVNFSDQMPMSSKSYVEGWTPLMSAAMNGDYPMAKLLVTSGAWVNYMNGVAITPLWFAAANGNMQVVKLLVKHKAYINNQNADDISPLMNAAMNGHLDVVKYLLAAKADPDLVHKEGDSALMFALGRGYSDIARLLVAAGARINITNKYGYSPLLVAVAEGNEEMVRLLIEKNADRTVKSDSGKTALDIAVAKGNENIIKMLK